MPNPPASSSLDSTEPGGRSGGVRSGQMRLSATYPNLIQAPRNPNDPEPHPPGMGHSGQAVELRPSASHSPIPVQVLSPMAVRQHDLQRIQQLGQDMERIWTSAAKLLLEEDHPSHSDTTQSGQSQSHGNLGSPLPAISSPRSTISLANSSVIPPTLRRMSRSISVSDGASRGRPLLRSSAKAAAAAKTQPKSKEFDRVKGHLVDEIDPSVSEWRAEKVVTGLLREDHEEETRGLDDMEQDPQPASRSVVAYTTTATAAASDQASDAGSIASERSVSTFPSRSTKPTSDGVTVPNSWSQETAKPQMDTIMTNAAPLPTLLPPAFPVPSLMPRSRGSHSALTEHASTTAVLGQKLKRKLSQTEWQIATQLQQQPMRRRLASPGRFSLQGAPGDSTSIPTHELGPSTSTQSTTSSISSSGGANSTSRKSNVRKTQTVPPPRLTSTPGSPVDATMKANDNAHALEIYMARMRNHWRGDEESDEDYEDNDDGTASEWDRKSHKKR